MEDTKAKKHQRLKEAMDNAVLTASERAHAALKRREAVYTEKKKRTMNF